MSDPFQPPSAAPLPEETPRRRWSLVGIIVGSVLTLVSLLGVVGTMAGMKKALHELGKSGIGDPSALSAGIGDVLIATAIAMLMPVGVIVLAVSLIFHFRKPQRPAAS